MIFHALQCESAVRGSEGGIDQHRRAGEARVRPHVHPHEIVRSRLSGRRWSVSTGPCAYSLATTGADLLITSVPALWEGCAGYDDGSVMTLQREVYDLEVLLVVLPCPPDISSVIAGGELYSLCCPRVQASRC